MIMNADKLSALFYAIYLVLHWRKV